MNESNIQPELESLHAKLAGEIERDEKQIEVIEKRVEKNRALLHAVKGSLGALVAQATGYGALTDNIRAVLKSLTKARFTAVDIEGEFRQSFPTAPMNKSAIRTALWNMFKRGEINCVQKGNNRQPAEYERTLSAGGGHRSGGRIVRKRTRPDAWKRSDAANLLPVNGEHSE